VAELELIRCVSCEGERVPCPGCGEPYCPRCQNPAEAFRSIRKTARGIACPEFVAETIAQMTAENPNFPHLVEEALKRREAVPVEVFPPSVFVERGELDDDEPDFLDELIAEEIREDSSFPARLERAIKRRERVQTVSARPRRPPEASELDEDDQALVDWFAGVMSREPEPLAPGATLDSWKR